MTSYDNDAHESSSSRLGVAASHWARSIFHDRRLERRAAQRRSPPVRTTFTRPATVDEAEGLLVETHTAVLEDLRIVAVPCLLGSQFTERRVALEGGDRDGPDHEIDTEFAQRCWRDILPTMRDGAYAFRYAYGWTDPEAVVVGGLLTACADDLRKQASGVQPGWAATAAGLNRDADVLLTLRDRWLALHKEPPCP